MKSVVPGGVTRIGRIPRTAHRTNAFTPIPQQSVHRKYGSGMLGVLQHSGQSQFCQSDRGVAGNVAEVEPEEGSAPGQHGRARRHAFQAAQVVIRTALQQRGICDRVNVRHYLRLGHSETNYH